MKNLVSQKGWQNTFLAGADSKRTLPVGSIRPPLLKTSASLSDRHGSPASTGLRPDRAELVIALALVALGAVVAWDAAHMRAGVAAYSRIGPRAFPYAIAIGLVAIGIATALFALRNAAPLRERDHVLPMAWIIGGLVVQIALLRYAGFAVATGAVFAATAKGFGRGRSGHVSPGASFIGDLVVCRQGAPARYALPAHGESAAAG